MWRERSLRWQRRAWILVDKDLYWGTLGPDRWVVAPPLHTTPGASCSPEARPAILPTPVPPSCVMSSPAPITASRAQEEATGGGPWGPGTWLRTGVPATKTSVCLFSPRHSRRGIPPIGQYGRGADRGIKGDGERRAPLLSPSTGASEREAPHGAEEGRGPGGCLRSRHTGAPFS